MTAQVAAGENWPGVLELNIFKCLFEFAHRDNAVPTDVYHAKERNIHFESHA